MKRILIVLCAVFFAAAPLFAYDWQAQQISPEPSLDKEDKTPAFKDAAGNIFYIENGADITDAEAADILKMKEVFSSWQSIKFKELRFVSENGVINAFIIPEKIEWNSLDIAPNLTAGMVFMYENQSLSYNFRIKKENYFLRINGAYISEKVLCDKMSEAIRTPQTFVQRRDPDYLLSHIDRMDAEMELFRKTVIAVNNRGLFSHDGPVDDKVIERVVSLKKENSKMTKKEVLAVLEKENIKISDRALELVFNVYFYEFEK
ncbi:MAG: hypothetical protein ACRCUT_14230 [Spirochaetota bacterium]